MVPQIACKTGKHTSGHLEEKQVSEVLLDELCIAPDPHKILASKKRCLDNHIRQETWCTLLLQGFW